MFLCSRHATVSEAVHVFLSSWTKTSYLRANSRPSPWTDGAGSPWEDGGDRALQSTVHMGAGGASPCCVSGQVLQSPSGHSSPARVHAAETCPSAPRDTWVRDPSCPNRDPNRPGCLPCTGSGWGEAERRLMTAHMVVSHLRLPSECYCYHFFGFGLKGRF